MPIISRKVMREVEEEIWQCDNCGKEIVVSENYEEKGGRCVRCCRIFCGDKSCGVEFKGWGGICGICASLSKKYRSRISELESQLQATYDEWEEESRLLKAPIKLPKAKEVYGERKSRKKNNA